MLVLSQLLTACSAPRAANVERNRKADELFKFRCQSAGEKITRTVKDVDGILLLKVRSTEINYSNQFRMDDPYGRDLGGEGYITSFLKAKHELQRRYRVLRNNSPTSRPDDQVGYSYVETVEPEGGQRFRYTAFVEQPGKSDPTYLLEYLRVVLQKAAVPGDTTRYGVTYDDISTHEDRLAWIAGSSLKVIDLQTKEVIAERVGYMLDRGQGESSAGRSPWILAASTACPAFPGRHGDQVGQTARFVEKVLIPVVP